MFKNSKISLKLNYLPAYTNGFLSPVLITMIEGNFLIPYFVTKESSVFLTIPKVNFFSNATLNPLKTEGIPFLSLNNNTLGTLGF